MPSKPPEGQLGLELWPREHDLPPRWDGRPVVWGEWDDTGRAFMCPPPKPHRCERCGSTRPRLFNVGRVWTNLVTTAPATDAATERQRLIGIISAFRCPGCGHDSVLDHQNREWVLDETDYTADGSWETASSGRPR